ncbi:GIY-YIG nuclease family protein [Corynebacterium mucifaciens]|uniref:GIY-YIG nuclease family protein n=1 Tax=Corynebacterium mucifaciens TaxID=57171 RepID=A0A7X6LTC2_9CORY|nr:GIY-YIG nuclease family protein [Corynebacterium mucifaciens]NKY69521.1 GIY-YIG nuclease family protein [Corynebacterium mucifaciens]
MGSPKTLQLFMMHGTADGPIKASIRNWVGRVYSIPRTELNSEELRRRAELNHPAVYFLVGTNPETDKPRIYIGQTAPRQNGVAFARAAEHSRSEDKDFFNRIIYVVVVDDSWGATEITFLENAFHQRAIKADRYEVANGNTPSAGSLSEETQAELDEFIENTNLIISALGISAFQPKAISSKSLKQRRTGQTPTPASSEDEPTFELTLPLHSVQGLGQRTTSGFLVLGGSTLRADLRPSAPRGVHATRERYADQIQDSALLNDIEFSSPSAAAAFLLGGSANGRVMWHLQNDPAVTLADWEDREGNEADLHTSHPEAQVQFTGEVCEH